MTVLLVVLATVSAFAGSDVIKVNTDSGTVTIKYDATDYSDLKVVVKKGSEKYIHNLYSSNEELPLQMGNGSYAVGLYKKVEGKKYKLVTSETFEFKANENTVYLASVQNVDMDGNSKATSLAKELTKNAKSDREKLEVIHEYVVNNVTYDYAKAATVSTRYKPSADATLASSAGMCYDYASLMAVMLRSVDVPTKLVKGQSNYTSVYHAWNEVLVDGEWVVVDATIDSASQLNGIKISLLKESDDYRAEKVF